MIRCIFKNIFLIKRCTFIKDKHKITSRLKFIRLQVGSSQVIIQSDMLCVAKEDSDELWNGKLEHQLHVYRDK